MRRNRRTTITARSPTSSRTAAALAADRGLRSRRRVPGRSGVRLPGDRGPGLAAAMAECERLAAEQGTCALVGAAQRRVLLEATRKQAGRHLIEIVVWAIKQDVQLLSVQDPEMLGRRRDGPADGRDRRHAQPPGQQAQGPRPSRTGSGAAPSSRRQFSAAGGRTATGTATRPTTAGGTGPLVIDPAEATVLEPHLPRLPGRRPAAQHRERAERRTACRDPDRRPLVRDHRPGGCSRTRSTRAGSRITGEGSFESAVPADHRRRHLGTRAPASRGAREDERRRKRQVDTRGSHLFVKGMLVCVCGGTDEPG